MVRKYHGKNIPEIGIVLSHHVKFELDILDKYEIAEGVSNVDVVVFRSQKKYDLIVSISTILSLITEHYHRILHLIVRTLTRRISYLILVVKFSSKYFFSLCASVSFIRIPSLNTYFLPLDAVIVTTADSVSLESCIINSIVNSGLLASIPFSPSARTRRTLFLSSLVYQIAMYIS